MVVGGLVTRCGAQRPDDGATTGGSVTKYGLLLPHFGEHASKENLLEGSRRAESLGFDSVWVRDHLVFEPHGEMEKPDRTFYDALTTLTAIGAVTESIELGTGSLIPFRHPLITALMAGTITQLVGQRLILGVGAGTFDHEFEAIGWGDRDRVELVRSNAAILRRVATESDLSYADDNFSFSNVTIEPRPVGGPIPFWYCGATPRSVRLAVDFCDGWMPGRISLGTLRQRIAVMDELSAAAGRSRPTIGVIPPTSIATSREEALLGVNVEGLLAWANKAKFTVKPPSGRFETVEDLEGQLIVGDPDEVVDECRKFEASGVDHVVFDLRFKFDRWFDLIDLLGKEVLPKLRGPA
jgi:alkanesulfonate monooxygenase SsuD/methylene tetrahydromethanopterin reductase-like flavin-dependent oxidoreductase (luciferase family)